MNRRLFFILALIAVLFLPACAGANSPARTGALTALSSNMFFGQGPWTRKLERIKRKFDLSGDYKSG